MKFNSILTIFTEKNGSSRKLLGRTCIHLLGPKALARINFKFLWMEPKPSLIARIKESKHKPTVIIRSKLVIVGDSCVGKSALTQVFLSDGTDYPKNYLMTIGADFAVKQLPIPDTNVIVEFFLFDCAGQTIFNHLDSNAKYYEGATSVIVAFDVSNQDSLLSCSKWYQGVRNGCGSAEMPAGILVGCKGDLRSETDREKSLLPTTECIRIAADLELPHVETSAVNNTGVDEPFVMLAREVHRRYVATTDRLGAQRRYGIDESQ